MKLVALFFSLLGSLVLGAQTKVNNFHFFELKVYEYSKQEQEILIDGFLQHAYLPFLHRNGRHKVGVFSDHGNDTSAVKKIYVLVPHPSLSDIPVLQKALFNDQDAMNKGKDYIDASSKYPAYNRITTYVLEGFRFAPYLMLPNLKSDYTSRVYELRSYESASEKKYWKKVEMFNEG
ncbi:MAG: hypothetical protein RL642_1179, partial [Bacteroidota bacterium]